MAPAQVWHTRMTAEPDPDWLVHASNRIVIDAQSVHAQCLTAFQQQDKGDSRHIFSPHVLQLALGLRGHHAARMEVHKSEWYQLGTVSRC